MIVFGCVCVCGSSEWAAAAMATTASKPHGKMLKIVSEKNKTRMKKKMDKNINLIVLHL